MLSICASPAKHWILENSNRSIGWQTYKRMEIHRFRESLFVIKFISNEDWNLILILKFSIFRNLLAKRSLIYATKNPSTERWNHYVQEEFPTSILTDKYKSELRWKQTHQSV